MIPAAIRSERLTLDSLLASDAESIYHYCQDAEIQRWLHIPSPYTRADAEYFATTYAADAARGELLTLWAIRSENRAMLGVIELRHEPLASATVGYWLGREHRGQSLMTEALQTLAEYALDPQGLDLQRLHWEAFTGNYASALVARRSGFHFEGTLRQSTVHRLRRVDTWHASLLRDDDRAPSMEGWPL
jgi:RimJ/RimL family protein N-acetyltransferase